MSRRSGCLAQQFHHFPRCYRLTSSSQFQNVLRRPQFRIHKGPLRLVSLPNQKTGARLGLVVGKRAIRKAHERNALKRTIREGFRLIRPDLPAHDVVVHVRAPIQRPELRRLLAQAWEQMKQRTIE